VYDQSGLVIVIRDGQRLDPPFLDVSPRLVKLGILGRFDETDYDERGLLGVALHPEFLANGRLFTYTSEPTSGTADFPSREVRKKRPSKCGGGMADRPENPDTVLSASRREILRLDHRNLTTTGAIWRSARMLSLHRCGGWRKCRR
jgi:hypothetical protein